MPATQAAPGTTARVLSLNKDRGHLCVGIDPRPGTFPDDYDEPDGLESWCLDLVDATAEHAAAFKPNLAFFLELGPAGLEALEATLAGVKRAGAMAILDAKFGDIGSTAQAYATFTADVVRADAVTVNPYLGTDALEPFLDAGLAAFVLARTTNPSARTIQDAAAGAVLDAFSGLDVGFVAPATDVAGLAQVRARVPEAPLLVPGVGAQGGSANEVATTVGAGPLLVNVSRGIAQADGPFPGAAAKAAEAFAAELASGLST